MTRMSPVGSLACVSCLKFNLHSVDSSHSCSFKTKELRVSKTQKKMKQASMANEACFKCQQSLLRWASKPASFFKAKECHKYYIRRYP